MNLNNFEKEKLIRILIDLFSYANKEMFIANLDSIKNGVSERNICACLKSAFDSIISNSIFKKYYADVEYNRGSGKTLKSYESNGHIFKMTCDFIFHSRGKFQLDNLICLEMKKKSLNQYLVDKDRERLKSLTTSGGCETIRRNLVVRDYYLGIFYVIDYNLLQIELEFYSEGALLDSKVLSFEDVMRYETRLSFFPTRNITFFNMNFGDSFLINDSGDALLVDCGSIKQSKARKKYMVDLIYNETEHLNNDLVITHYHFDHTSSILNLNNKGIKFNNIYIRCLDIKCFDFDFYSSFVELLLYAMRSHDYNTFIQWLNPSGFINLLYKNGRVHGVNCANNNKIYFGRTTANVLWPSPNDNKLDELEIITGMVESILFDNMADNLKDDFVDLIKRKIKGVHEFYKSIYQRLVNNSEGISKEELNSILNDIDYDEKNDISEKVIQIFINTIKIPRYIRKRLSDLENHLSIVFEIDSQLLMCGDADNSAMNGALLNYANAHGYSEIKTDEFEIIKVPHHGTTNYYYDFKNDKASYLIPDSKIYKTSWMIDKKYVDGNIKCFSLNNGYKSACPNSRICGFKCPYVGTLDKYTFWF